MQAAARFMAPYMEGEMRSNCGDDPILGTLATLLRSTHQASSGNSNLAPSKTFATLELIWGYPKQEYTCPVSLGFRV